jgi:hypothetical protein
MGNWVIVLIIIAFAAAFAAVRGYLNFLSARARERAGLPPRARVKLPLYVWALLILLLCINAASFFSHSHGVP